MAFRNHQLDAESSEVVGSLGTRAARVRHDAAIWQIVGRFLPEFDPSDAFYALRDADDTTDKPLPLGVVVETARRHLRGQQESIENRRRGGEYTDRGIGEIRIRVEQRWWRQHGMTTPTRGYPRARARERRPRSRRVASSPRRARAPDKPHPAQPEEDLDAASPRRSV